ncbi:MAG: metallophosphoesterase family protein [Spirochaetia bacterium]|jgi:UDP-2,3-diacylglucosamine pyrophosphatase LpxH|nr:metallophosphoesterase family protein [Spirochaetia bacterium]
MFIKNIARLFIKEYLDSLYKNAPEINLGKESRIVIFSDLHVGSKTRRDDFLPNSAMFLNILENYYLAKDYTMILNGDVEELQKRPLKKVKAKWPELYNIFSAFENKGKLFKIAGNHDSDLFKSEHSDINRNLLDSLVLNHEGNSILIFHGHQASIRYMMTPKFMKYILKYIAQPLGIKNFTRSYDNTSINNTEKMIYEYSRERKIISIIGHTHRPLFESLSEIDLLRFKIENLLRIYPSANGEKTDEIEEEIKKYKEEIETILSENHEYRLRSGIYNKAVIIPTIFNSGSVIGKRGLSAIEIKNRNISLVHWFDKNSNVKNYSYPESVVRGLGSSSYRRAVVKRDSLDYIFTRIRLLS